MCAAWLALLGADRPMGKRGKFGAPKLFKQARDAKLKLTEDWQDRHASNSESGLTSFMGLIEESLDAEKKQPYKCWKNPHLFP
jgi:hypothetical protein